jgi:hypothetical protein
MVHAEPPGVPVQTAATWVILLPEVPGLTPARVAGWRLGEHSARIGVRFGCSIPSRARIHFSGSGLFFTRLPVSRTATPFTGRYSCVLQQC